ncbi:hypothetical protein SO802_007889 [Lithocarpus litseifolius]|uniref:Bulb-type lectin domain-containing protein n=1 Tax=Lithocarpus litseifolius TaxID=425828 RepID=A0AAW2DUZ7_9ROSI
MYTTFSVDGKKFHYIPIGQTPSHLLNPSKTLATVSSGSAFKLGFFSLSAFKGGDFEVKGGDFELKLAFFVVLVNSTNRYIGIWYSNIFVFTVVWVANRETPLNDSSGVLTISEDGNLVVVDGKKEILWSSNVTYSVANSSAQLLDSGNLVLQEKTTGTIIWESYQLPCDTLLPKMKISTNVRTDGFSLINDHEGTFSLSFSYVNDSLLHFALKTHGNIEQRSWDYEKEDWEVSLGLQSECDFYGNCGAFGSCNSQNTPICNCLQGFEPKITKEWNRGNWTSGCVRRT